MSDHVVHLGDCLDPVSGLASLADKSVNHVICDPPYSEHVHSCVRRGETAWKSGKISSAVPVEFAALSGAVRQEAAIQIGRVVRGWALVFSDTESAHLWREELHSFGAEYVRTLFWRKLLGAPQFTGDRPAVACEAITACYAGAHKGWNGGGRQGFYPFPVATSRPGRQEADERCHTTQKPLALMEALVRDFTDPGDLVCDPFAGSGTTGVACKRLGRRFIGWEKDPKYHAIAGKRIAATQEQLRLLPEAGPPSKQAPLDLAGGGDP